MIQKKWCFHFSITITKEDQGTTTGITSSGDEIPLSAIRPCGMGVPSIETLNTSESLYFTIGYLLKVECGDLET